MTKIAFRVDSGFHIGNGHIIRCLTLATEFKLRGCEVCFITKDHAGFSDNFTNDFETYIIPGGRKSPLPDYLKEDYSSWLGTSLEEDLYETNRIIHAFSADLVAIDHYGITEDYERKLSSPSIFVIDDLMKSRHHCQFLLNQNPIAKAETYLELLSDPKPILFLGLKFALLRREFQDFRNKMTSRNFPPQKILVFFGGADIGHDTLKMISSLSSLELNKYRFTILLPPSHPTFSKVYDLVQKAPHALKLLPYTSEMARLMSEHDFFIGASGSTSWERIALQLPSAIVSVASNQEPNCQFLGEHGLAINLGKSSNFKESDWINFFRSGIIDSDSVRSISENCENLIDGEGASRVVATILNHLPVEHRGRTND